MAAGLKKKNIPKYCPWQFQNWDSPGGAFPLFPPELRASTAPQQQCMQCCVGPLQPGPARDTRSPPPFRNAARDWTRAEPLTLFFSF
jgi:hypothetical protein